MALSESDKQDIYDGLYEVYEELYPHNIKFLTFDEVTNALTGDDVYEEKHYKAFLHEIFLIGKVSIGTSEEELMESGVYQKDSATFSFSLRELTEKVVISLGEDLILKSRLEFNNIQYEIVELKPELILSDQVFKYVMKGKRVRK